MNSQATKSLSNYIVLLPIVIFVYYGLAYINKPGLTYDETLFVNAALGGVTDDLIYKRWFGVPVMILPHLGALKSWLYFPVFKFFGVSIYTIRVPVVLISALTLFIWYKNFEFIFKENFFKIIPLLILATDPVFILHSKFDVGPTVLQNLFVALTFFFYFKFIYEEKSVYLFSLLLAMLLGLYNKLNFIWFINALTIAALLFNHKKIMSNLRQHLFLNGFLLGLFLIAILMFMVYLIVPAALHFPMGDQMQAALLSKINFITQLYVATMNGSIFSYYQFAEITIPGSWTNVIELSVCAAWFLSLLAMKINDDDYRWHAKQIYFLLTIFMLVLLQVIITPQARLSEHLMLMWPLQHIIFMLALASLCLLTTNMIFINVLKILPFLLVISQMYVNDLYLLAYKDPNTKWQSIWSPEIYALANYLNIHANEYDEILPMDFGIHNQIFSLAQNNNERLKFHDVWFLFNDTPDIIKARNFVYPQFAHSDEENREWLYNQYFVGKHDLVVMLAENDGTQMKFDEFARRYKLKVKTAGNIGGVYEMFESGVLT